MKRSEKQWQKMLDPEQYAVLRKGQTEAPFSGVFLYNDDDGTYVCAACGQELFSSEHKFDAVCGWPSFNNVINDQYVVLKEDLSHGLRRVEVSCRNCDSHLGHVFNDAIEQPAGMRFCINSLSLHFKLKNHSKISNKKGKK